MLKRRTTILLACLLGLSGWSASAQLLQPPPARPDALMNAVTSEVIAILKQVLVRSFLRRPGAEPLTIDYSMEDSLAGWKVFDVTIAGVSLVLNYRETFAAAVRSGGIDGLIKSLSEKNRQNEAAPNATGASGNGRSYSRLGEQG